MEQIISNIVTSITDNAFSTYMNSVKHFCLEAFHTVMNWINISLWDFWNESIVLSLLNAATFLSILSLVIGTVFLFNDIAEQIEQIDIKIVLFSLAKGFVFAISARWIALSFFYAANLFVSALNIQLDPNTLMDFINSNVGLGLGSTVLLLIVIVIALAVFFFMQLGRFAAMLIHIISVFAYVPFIVCGDTQKIKEWISMALSIALTYCIQFVFFYSGISLIVSGKLIIGGVLMIGSFIAAKELKNFGHATGASNALRGSASMAYQAISGLKSLGAV